MFYSIVNNILNTLNNTLNNVTQLNKMIIKIAASIYNI